MTMQKVIKPKGIIYPKELSARITLLLTEKLL